FVRVSGESAFIEIGGQRLSGDFAFQQIAIDPGTDGIPGTPDDLKAVRISAANVALAFGDGQVSFLSVSEGSGHLLMLPVPGGATGATRGIAGRLQAKVGVNVPGVSVRGDLVLEVNTTNREVDEVFFLGGLPIELRLEAGDYVRVAGQNIAVDVVGQTLRGNFGFQRVTDSRGTVVNVAFDRVELGLG